MQITPTDFKVVTWEYDKNIFNGIKSKNIQVIPDFGAGSITGSSKKAEIPMVILGVQWQFQLLYTNKAIVNYLARDEYMASTVERNNDQADLNEMILISYNKFRQDINGKLEKLGADYRMDVLDTINLDNIREDLQRTMKEKGI